MLIELAFVFFFSLASLYMLRKAAKIVGLVDKPNERKQHEGFIPLVGGIAVFITLAQYIYNNPNIFPHSTLFLVSIAVLTIVGAVDDKFDISFKIRLLVQAFLTIVMIYISGLELNHIGNILGIGNLYFGALAPIITVLAVVGTINAFNMVDGIDGLLGGLSIVTFTSVAVIMQLQGQTSLASFCIVIVVAMLPYVLMNLGLLGRRRRVFMGDAGSMMIGFSVIWLLLSASQATGSPVMRPVTALWLIALPLMDMAAIMYRRIKRRRSPFRPDREHLHHVCQRIGLSNKQTLMFICGLAMAFAGFGIIGEVLLLPESIMFITFIVCFFTYNLLLLKNLPYHLSERVAPESSPQNDEESDHADDVADIISINKLYAKANPENTRELTAINKRWSNK